MSVPGQRLAASPLRLELLALVEGVVRLEVAGDGLPDSHLRGCHLVRRLRDRTTHGLGESIEEIRDRCLADALLAQGEEVAPAGGIERPEIDCVRLVEARHGSDQEQLGSGPAGDLASQRLVDTTGGCAIEAPDLIEQRCPGEHGQRMRLLERGDEEPGERVELGISGRVFQIRDHHREEGPLSSSAWVAGR